MITMGPLCAVLSSLTWAVGSSGYSRLSRSHSAFAVNFSRAVVALPLFVLAVFVSAGGWQAGLLDFAAVKPEHVGWFALSMFASYGFGDVLFLWSTRSLGVPGALAIASAYPLWTALAGFFFWGETLTAFQVGGLFLTLIGIVAVILSGPANANVASRDRTERAIARGVLLALLTSVMWATNSYSVAHAGRSLAAPVGNTVRMIFALVLSAGLGRFIFREPRVMLPFADLRKNLWLFALEAFGGSYFFMYGLSHSPLAIGSTLASLAPVMSVPVAWAFGLEKFSPARTAGVCLVVAGIWLLVG